jgi:hypothetical protein
MKSERSIDLLQRQVMLKNSRQIFSQKQLFNKSMGNGFIYQKEDFSLKNS